MWLTVSCPMDGLEFGREYALVFLDVAEASKAAPILEQAAVAAAKP